MRDINNLHGKDTIKFKRRSPWYFLALVWILSLPFWILSYFIKGNILPENFPLTDIGAAFTPTLAAAILTYYEGGSRGVKQLFGRVFDFKRTKNKKVFLIMIFLFPVLYILTYFSQMIAGIPVKELVIPPLGIFSALLVFFFIGAIFEELGYAAYATERFEKLYSPLATALIIGVPWALWHLNSMVQIGQSPALILWGLAGTVAVRVIYVWLFNTSGFSVFSLILCHTIANTARTFYPGSRSAYELGDGAIGYGIIITFALLVVIFTRSLLGKNSVPMNRP